MSREIFHVAAILDSHNLAITAGENYGLSKGTKIEVFEEGEEIFHPISKESLGNIILVKATLEIVHVDEKYSICQQFSEEEVVIPGSITRMTDPFADLKDKKVVRKNIVPLTVNPDEIIDTRIVIPTEQAEIRVGDQARIPY